MSTSGIQGLPLEVTVVGCYNLKDKEWISRQDPYVCLEYGSTKYRTKTCTDGGKNPTFQEKFVFPLIEGLRELNTVVWNSNTLMADEFIGSGRIQLHRVLSQGFDDSTWPLVSRTGRHSGEVRLIMHYPTALLSEKAKTKLASEAPQYTAPSSVIYQGLAPPCPPTTAYAYSSPSPYTPYPAQTTTYSFNPSPPPGYPPQTCLPPPPPPSIYPQYTYPQSPSVYPPQPYPPPPQPQASSYYPPGPPSGIYPPRPY